MFNYACRHSNRIVDRECESIENWMHKLYDLRSYECRIYQSYLRELFGI